MCNCSVYDGDLKDRKSQRSDVIKLSCHLEKQEKSPSCDELSFGSG